MSQRKSGAGAFESAEDDLLNDGGAAAFKLEEDEIDEEALLGLGDDDGGDGSYLLDDMSGAVVQDTFGGQQEELLEIGVDEEEVNELSGEEESFGTAVKDAGGVMEEDVEQLDYVDDLPQADDQEVHVEYDENVEVNTEADLSQEEGQQMSLTQSSLSDTPTQAVKYSKESESESEDSDGEKTGRGRFKSERSNIITIGKAKSRTDIPDTLEVSAEQQAQIDRFPDRRQRDRNQGNRGRGRDQQQRGGFRGNNRNNHQGVGPIRVNLGINRQQRDNNFHLGRMGSPARPMGPQRGAMNRGLGDKLQGGLFGRPPFGRGMAPQALLGPRMVLPNQVGGFNMARPLPQGNLAALIPGGPPSSMGVSPPRPVFQQAVPQSQPSVFGRAGVPVSAITSRPHTIHINPNFRGTVASSMSSAPPMIQSRPFSQPSLSPSGARLPSARPPLMQAGGERLLLGQGPVRPGMPGQPQRFPQSQGFPRGPRMGVSPNQPGRNALLGQQQQQQQGPRFGSFAPGMGQGGVMGSPIKQPPPSSSGFSGQRMPPPQLQNPPPGFGSPPPTSMSMPPPTVHRFAAPQQGLYRGPTPQQQLQQQQQQPGLFQRQVGVQPQRGGVALQNCNSSMAKARQLAQQARNMQKAKVSSQMTNKNITVVPLKRHSIGEEYSGPSPIKVAKVAGYGPLTEDDLELKKGLEEQKRLREMIRKRKEEARRKQAEERRRDLECRLQDKGMSLEAMEGQAPEGGSSSSFQTLHFSEQAAAPDVRQGAQRIKTVVTRGGKKHLLTATRRTQQIRGKQQLNQQQQQQQRPQEFVGQGQRQGRGYPPSSAPPGQFGGQGVQQPPPPAMFTRPPPMHQPPPTLNPRGMSSPGFGSQQFSAPPPQLSGPPPSHHPTPRAPGPQASPYVVAPPPSPFSRAPPVLFQSPRVVRQGPPPGQGHPNPPPVVPQQQFSPRSSSTAASPVSVVRHVQHANNSQAMTPGIGRGVALALARGGGQGQGVPGRGGQMVVRGRGQAQGVRGRGQVMPGMGRGGVGMTGTPVVVPSPSPQGPSNRTVIPVGRGRMVMQGRGGGGVATGVMPPPGRTVVQRQVMAHAPPPVNAKVQRGAIAGVGVQKLSIDNLALGTTELQIRQGCEAVGPVLGVVMLETQRKAIVTFANKMHGVLFAKQWNRRMINMSVVTVTLLP
ncbi:hypothetical protein ACOMHN_057402 [Nucella lapillus]